jgi:hypothetical protein
LQANFFYTSHGFEQVGIQWETRDIPQDLAVSFMHQLSSNSLQVSNHYHWHLACYHLAYYYHLACYHLAYYYHLACYHLAYYYLLAFLQASDSDASAEEL